jgi:hypothetical protein
MGSGSDVAVAMGDSVWGWEDVQEARSRLTLRREA